MHKQLLALLYHMHAWRFQKKSFSSSLSIKLWIIKCTLSQFLCFGFHSLATRINYFKLFCEHKTTISIHSYLVLRGDHHFIHTSDHYSKLMHKLSSLLWLVCTVQTSVYVKWTTLLPVCKTSTSKTLGTKALKSTDSIYWQEAKAQCQNPFPQLHWQASYLLVIYKFLEMLYIL